MDRFYVDWKDPLDGFIMQVSEPDGTLANPQEFLRFTMRPQENP